MVQLFIFLFVKLMQIMLRVLWASVRLAWKIIKGEFYLIKVSFQKYPIGFFSFFIHFIGFWVAAGMSFYPNGSIFLRLYTLGIFGDMDDYGEFVWLPLDLLALLMPNSGEGVAVIWALIGYFLMVWLVLSAMLLVFEAAFFLFPIVYAALTQLILGALFKDFVHKWRNKRSEKLLRKVERDYQVNQSNNIDAPTNQAASTNSFPELVDEGNGRVSVSFQRQFQRPIIRDMDEAYRNAIERISDRTLTLYQVHETLVEMKGKHESVERLYEREFELHRELQDLYFEAFETISCSTDMQEVNQAYADLKRAAMLLKNAQADLTNEMKKAYEISA